MSVGGLSAVAAAMVVAAAVGLNAVAARSSAEHAGTRGRGRTGSRFVVLALVAVALVACDRLWIVGTDRDDEPVAGLTTAVLSPDRGDAYTLEDTGGTLRVASPSANDGANLRMVFWPAGAPDETDGRSCATWTAQSGDGRFSQQGAALRVRVDEGTVTKAVTVSKNVMYEFVWILNVHGWDAGRRTGLGQVDLGPALKGRPYPWNICVRTTGTSLTVRAWAGEGPAPAWDDPAHTGSVTLPAEWVYPGTTGWYLGHLPPGGSAEFADLTT
jgi:hypothetical protein